VSARKFSTFNVDAVFMNDLYFEYDGSYWHSDKLELDTAKTVEILKAGHTVLRVRDRLPELEIVHENYRCVTIDERTGHETVAKEVCTQLWGDTTPKEFAELWIKSKSLAERAFQKLLSPDQRQITDLFLTLKPSSILVSKIHSCDDFQYLGS
jgi:hypothetical protein